MEKLLQALIYWAHVRILSPPLQARSRKLPIVDK
jgi:hypothetical protein